MRMLHYIWLIALLSIAISALAFSTFSSSAFSSSLDNNTVLQQAQKALETNQNQSFLRDAPTSQSVTDNLQKSSKIIKSPGSMSTYENNDYGISIKFPSDWKPSEVNLGTHAVVLFLAPEKSITAADYVFEPAGLVVASQRLPSSNLTLSEFIESFIRDTYQNATEYRVISKSRDNLGGLDSEKIIMYEYIGGSYKLLRDIAIDHKTGTAYWIMYSAHPGLYSDYLPLVEQMIDSFKLVNKP